MSHGDRAALNRLLKNDLAAFTQRCFQTVAPGHVFLSNWHIDLIAWHLEQCLHGEIKRLIINLPPRSLKSIIASVAFPAWALGHDPTMRIIAASYAHDLAAKHARESRAVMETPWYRQVFPTTRIDPSKNAELEFEMTRKGYRLSTSVGGTLTGRGGNLIIVDDPLKASDAMSDTKRDQVNQWFENTLFSRLDDKANDRIVMQRLHDDDLVGHLLRYGTDWVCLSLPAVAQEDECFELYGGATVGRKAGEALHPERESLETLETIRQAQGTHAFSAQYLQSPIPPGGNMIKLDWFRRYGPVPEPEGNDQIVQSWDTASKASEISDYSVCTTWLWRGNDHYLIDVRRVRLEYPALKKCIADTAAMFNADTVLIEDKGSGTSLIQDLMRDGMVRPIGINPVDDKVTRMYAQSAKIEAGHLLLPENAPWLDAFLHEILQFPHGKHDDQVDSVSQYLNWQSDRVPSGAPILFAESRIAQEWDAEFGHTSAITGYLE